MLPNEMNETRANLKAAMDKCNDTTINDIVLSAIDLKRLELANLMKSTARRDRMFYKCAEDEQQPHREALE